MTMKIIITKFLNLLSNLRFRALDISLIEKHTFINEKKKIIQKN